jgi:flagellar hook protein FlgE
VPTTTASSTAAAGTLKAAGGLSPPDFASNPLVLGTPPVPFGDNTVTGQQTTTKGGVGPINGNTTLSGPGTTPVGNALTQAFAVNDTLTVNATPSPITITFVASGAAGNQLNITDNVTTLLAKIDSITGTTNASTINAQGQITLHTGVVQNLSITAGGANATSALGSLGFASPVTATRTGGGTPGTGVVIGNDLTTFNNESISGGAVTTFNGSGTPINLQLRWAKSDSASLGSPHQDTWNLFYQSDPNATNLQVAWTNVGTNFVFNANGALTSPAGSAITIPNVTVGGQSLGNVSLNIASGALTQFASTSGAATVNTISQNGFAAGQLQSVAINNSGIVVGTFTNGQNIDLAAVTLSHFNGTNLLKALDGGAYAVTDLSGPAISGASGKISGSSIEGSNTDIADEFTKLIVTQQAYSANTKVITTANTMVQTLLDVIH